MSWEMELDEGLLEDLYLWIDALPLSRPKKRIERDFSDGQSLELSHRSHGYSSVLSVSRSRSAGR